MLSRPLALALVGAGCIAAAGIGAYVAVRHNATEPGAPPAAVSAARAPQEAPKPAAVAETEAIVTDTHPTPPSSPAAAVAPTPPAAPSTPAAKRPAPAVRAGRQAPAAVKGDAGAGNRPATPPVDPKWTGLDRPWPQKTAEPPPAEASAPPAATAQAPVTVEPPPPEPSEPPPPQYEELVVGADSVIGLQVDTSTSTATAQLEDLVEARVTRDVTVTGKVAVPAGTRVLGSVTLVERGGKVKERARLGVRFHTLVLADATRLPIQTDSIFRDGEPPSNQSVAKIGGAAVGGAILGAILGGAKGAVIGGATGAAGGTAAVMAGDRNAATLPAGAIVTVRLTAPVTVTVER